MSKEMNKFYDLLDQIDAIEIREGLGMAEGLRAQAEKALKEAQAAAAAPNLDHPIINHLTDMMA